MKFNFPTLLGTSLILFSALAGATEVNVYSARKEALIKPVLDRFTEQTGISVNLVTGKADALLQRLQQEGDNSPADLLLTVDAGRLYRAKEAGVLRTSESATLAQVVPPHYRDPEGYWYGLSVRARVFMVAADRVADGGPKTYADLADEKWRGKICIRSSDNIYNQSLVAAQIAHNGQQPTETWAAGLVANMARKPSGGDRDQIKAVAVGQCDIAVANTYYLGVMLTGGDDTERQMAQTVTLVWPDQDGFGTHVNVSGAGITASSKHPAEALQLIEFLAGEEAQQWYAETNHEYPVRAGIPVSELLKSWGEFKADDLSLDQLGIHNADAVKLMDRAGWK